MISATASAWIAAISLSAATPISLDEVRKQSRENTQAALALLELERTQEQVRLSRSAILPRVSANATIGGGYSGPAVHLEALQSDPGAGGGAGDELVFQEREAPGFGQGSFDLNLQVSQLIYDGGRWWSQIAQSGALAEAQAGQVEEQRLASELEGVRRFYELYRAQEAMGLLRANVSRSEQHLDRARSLFEAGRAQRVDVLSAQVNLGNDRLEVTRQSARIVDAQTRLAVWLARPGAEELEASAPALLQQEPASPPAHPEVAAVARQQRPLLRAVSQQVRAAELGVDVARGDNLPRVSAQAQAGRRSPNPGPFFLRPERQNYVQGGVNVRWDLFTGFQTDAQVQQAHIARRRAEVELQQAERELEAEVRTAHAALAAQVEASAIAKSNLEVARQGLDVAETRFKAGAGSTLEVRDAQLKLTQAELSFLQTRIDVEIARAALDRAVGQGVAP